MFRCPVRLMAWCTALGLLVRKLAVTPVESTKVTSLALMLLLTAYGLKFLFTLEPKLIVRTICVFDVRDPT